MQEYLPRFLLDLDLGMALASRMAENEGRRDAFLLPYFNILKISLALKGRFEFMRLP